MGDDPPARRPPARDGHARAGCAPGPSRSPSPTWSATWSGCWTSPGRSGRSSRSAARRCCEYVTMLRRVARIKNRPLVDRAGPAAHPGLSSRWLALVTDVDTQTGRSLIDSMANEVVVTRRQHPRVVPFEPMGYDEAVRAALARARRRSEPDDLGAAPLPGGGARVRRLDGAAAAARSAHVVPVEHLETAAVVRRRRRVVAGVSVLGTGLLGALAVDQAGLPGVLRDHRRRRGHLDRRRRPVRAAASGLDPEPRPAPAPPGHHAGRDRCRCVRVLLRLRPGRQADPRPRPGDRQRAAVRRGGPGPPGRGHHPRQRPGRGDLLPRCDVRRAWTPTMPWSPRPRSTR